ncbi:MAG: copper homeostasis protein CutC [Pricia sp.]|nr:copper homeostasis protein CutC [Pricia sp.]
MLVEVCANSLESALNAQRAGAHRIELCSELGVGGITPSYGLLKSVQEKVSIPVHVLIRPRSGDFTYSETEFDILKRDIAFCVELGFQGIVTGVLHKNFTLDVERTKTLVEASRSLKFTFHRAFDWVKNPLDALAQLETIGVDCILTSGQQKSAVEGIELLTEMHHKASNSTIMPGGGVRKENIEVFKKVGFHAIHLSGTKFIQSLSEPPAISMNSSAFLKEGQIALSDTETIRSIVNTVK